MLECVGLTKQYGRLYALHDLSCGFDTGVYGVLGPNGAGKSTMMKILSCVLEPTSGNVTYDGVPIRKLGAEYRRMLGVLPQDPPVYSWMRGREFLSYLYRAKELPSADEAREIDRVLDLMELSEWGRQKIRKYSGGMRQRLGIAQALLGSPKILLLDEPTAGLDPRQRVQFKSILRSMAGTTTVILCTHIVSDLSDLADQILIMNAGRKIDVQPPETLIRQMEGKVWWCEETAEALNAYPGALHALNNGISGLRFISKEPPEHAVSVTPTLEDLYLYHFKEASK
ncbi:MAG: ABC transporter ATP-binding protein [Christensenellales bacterium]|jgi:ABC-2 type transport system ATP-binding protein